MISTNRISRLEFYFHRPGTLCRRPTGPDAAAGPGRLGQIFVVALRERHDLREHQIPGQIKTPDGTAGVIFWSVNNDNYYVAQIMPDGTYTIDRKFAGTWISLVPRTPNEHIARGANAVNEVGIVLADNLGALFINKAKVQEFRGQPPTGGASIGLHAESETALADDWRFLDIVVMDNGKSKPVVLPPSPSGPTIADCRPINPGDFQDTFTKPDPGWGLGDPATFYIDSQLSLKPDEDAGLKALYLPLFFKNVTLCATVKFPNQAVDLGEDAPNGGLAFWASDLGNLYKAAIFPEREFQRRSHGQQRMANGRPPDDVGCDQKRHWRGE